MALVLLLLFTACSKKEEPLDLLVNREQVDKVKESIEKGADVNEGAGTWTPLKSAAMTGNKEITKILLDNGADVNATDYTGCTPLFSAVNHADREYVKMFIEAGADVNARDDYGHTVLISAVDVMGGLGVVELLIANGAEINAKGIAKSSALYVAASSGNKEVVEFLIANGAEINAPVGDDEWTALSIAAFRGWKDIVILLIENGANVHWQSPLTNKTALDHAREKGRSEVIKLLEKFEQPPTPSIPLPEL